MKAGGCEGTVTVAYGGVACGTITVTNPLKDYQGAVTGSPTLSPGETAIYYHDLGAGAIYTGDLPGTPFENAQGNGFIGTMSPSAPGGDIYKVSFTGPCNSKATMNVEARSCWYDAAGVVWNDESTWPRVGDYYRAGGRLWQIFSTAPQGPFEGAGDPCVGMYVDYIYSWSSQGATIHLICTGETSKQFVYRNFSYNEVLEDPGCL